VPPVLRIALLAAASGLLVACGARSGLDGLEDVGGIPCGELECDPATQFCARCDGPDDDRSYESRCIDRPESIPDWWGVRYPGCDRPVATFDCTDDAHCGRGARCVGEATYTFCLERDEPLDLCDPRIGLTPICESIADCPTCAAACEPPQPDWPVSLCARRP
jgi:hypothetical protein